MSAQQPTTAILIAVLTPTFGHFNTISPLWTRVRRWRPALAGNTWRQSASCFVVVFCARVVAALGYGHVMT